MKLHMEKLGESYFSVTFDDGKRGWIGHGNDPIEALSNLVEILKRKEWREKIEKKRAEIGQLREVNTTIGYLNMDPDEPPFEPIDPHY